MDYQNNEPRMSVREVVAKYEKLQIKPAELGRVNCYQCLNCDYVMKTIDINYGVTPMFMKCPECGQRNQSTGYLDIAPDKEPDYEWRVPTLDEALKMRRTPEMLYHIFSGGLELYKIKKPFVSREEGAKLREANRLKVSGITKISLVPMEVLQMEVSRKDLEGVVATMEKHHRLDGYIAQVEGKLIFLDLKPEDLDAARITKDQINRALEG